MGIAQSPQARRVSKDTPCGACAPAEDVRGEPFSAGDACGEDPAVPAVPAADVSQTSRSVRSISFLLAKALSISETLARLFPLSISSSHPFARHCFFTTSRVTAVHPVGHLRSTLSLDRRGREIRRSLGSRCGGTGLWLAFSRMPARVPAAAGMTTQEVIGSPSSSVPSSTTSSRLPKGAPGERILRVLDGCRDDPVLVPFDRDLRVIRAR